MRKTGTYSLVSEPLKYPDNARESAPVLRTPGDILAGKYITYHGNQQ
jgi:hypothetical protein